MDIRYDRGAAVRIDVEVRRLSDGALFDPTAITCTIYKEGTTVVSAVAMTKDSTGKYYYIWQTVAGSTVGKYGVKIASTSGSYTCVRNNPIAFRLE